MAKQRFDQGADAAGIPDSPILRREVQEQPPNPVLSLHCGGVLVSDLPLEMQARILYQQTDEGVAEFNEGKSERRFSVTKDEFTKTMDHRKDAVIDLNMDPNQAPNPMRELMDKHIVKGMRGRFLSPKVVDRRGMRNWEPVLDKDGKRIMVRDQFLSQMPESAAIARNKAVREHGNKMLGQVKDQYLSEGGQTAVSDKA